MALRSRTMIAITLAAPLVAGSAASADPLTFDIHSDTHDRFQFSLFHTAHQGSDNQSGTILYFFDGTFDLEIQGSTLAFTDFQGQIMQGNGQNATPIQGSSIALNTQTNGQNANQLTVTNTQSDGGRLVEGNLALDVDLGSAGGTGTLDFEFEAQDFVTLANKFFDGTIPSDAPGSDDRYGLGLWGVAQDQDGLFTQGDSGDELIGLDLYGTAVPLPHPIALAGVGICGVAGIRRIRRC